MKTRLFTENPADIEFTMKITMKAKEWEELRGQLNDAYPTWKLSSAITDLLAQARKTFYPSQEDDE